MAALEIQEERHVLGHGNPSGKRPGLSYGSTYWSKRRQSLRVSKKVVRSKLGANSQDTFWQTGMLKREMIAISSARRHDRSSEYAANQIRAVNSWRVFPTVYYFGSYEEDLKRDNVRWVKSGDWPTIKEMASFASQMTGDLVAIINADIVVTAPILEVEKKLKEITLPASTSYRYEFDPATGDLESAARFKEDRGMDIFVATQHSWKLVADRIPEYLRIGHPTHDSWLCGFFCYNYGYGFRQFTEKRCVFHPKHGGRETPLGAAIRSDDVYFTRAHVPSPL